MDSPNLDRVLRIKTNSVRGGAIEYVEVAGAAIDIDFKYEEGEAGDFKPVVRDIDVRGLTCAKSRSALTLAARRGTRANERPNQWS